ncbi:MAG: ATP-dependent DNA helicase RecG [Oscillospiraceae bacterium]|jgi:ATP-dependent DNA helicase RecG
MSVLDTDIRFIKGIGEKRAKLFNKLGITDLLSLLSYYPRDYEDRTVIKTIGEACDGETVGIRAIVASEPRVSHIRRGLDITKLRAVDEKDALDLTFFNQSYIKNSLKRGESYVFFGKVIKNLTKTEMQNPIIERDGEGAGGIVPVYSLTAGLSQNVMRSAVAQGLKLAAEELHDPLPASLRERLQLCHYRYAVENIHFPEGFEELGKARRRLVFQELFILSCGLRLLKTRRSSTDAPVFAGDVAEFLGALSFSLTGAQKRALEEIMADLRSGRPMNRLVQGDVGSGKTVVAAAAAYLAARGGCQAALMAPTEILAQQHYNFMAPLMGKFGIRTALLTGGLKAAEKRAAQAAAADGSADLIIGTHALISGGVEYKNLGLVITDEQHRFGVAQRAALSGKGERAHLLVMSATPIPRTMALIVYGDLDISVIDELPPGRSPVKTFVVGEEKRSGLYGFVRKEVAKGRQVYIVCPAVEEGELPDLKAAETYAEELREREFSGLRVAMLHGRMKAAEKDKIMKCFQAGEYDILVATTVIEVGVDVPNATVMVVENAERFGLGQLHQLRGRVGRGEGQSWCFLVTDTRGETARERLEILCRTNDGFLISEEDLRLRGPGDFFGRRQHGLPDLKIASFSGDMRLLREAQDEADALLEDPKTILSREYDELRHEMRRLFEAGPDIFN